MVLKKNIPAATVLANLRRRAFSPLLAGGNVMATYFEHPRVCIAMRLVGFLNVHFWSSPER